MGILFRVLFSLSFETRVGNLKADQFDELKVSRYTRYLTATKDGKQSFADELEKRYPGTQFDQTIISLALLKALLFDGEADKDAIQAELDHSPYYAPPGTEPAWKTAWRIWVVDDDTFEKAVEKVEQQFKKREYVIPGEMFHVFGLRLLFSEIGAIDTSKIDVVHECKRYLDYLRESGKILNKYTDKADIDINIGWHNLGFYNTETDDFQEILKYYRLIVEEIAKASFPELGRNLLRIMKSNHEKYFRMICANDFEMSIYYNVPVLAAIPANDFVGEVLKLDANSQGTVFTAFKCRYDHGLLERELKDEKKWLQEIKSLFKENAKELRLLSKHRILSHVKRSIDPFLVSENVSSE